MLDKDLPILFQLLLMHFFCLFVFVLLLCFHICCGVFSFAVVLLNSLFSWFCGCVYEFGFLFVLLLCL